MRDGSCDCNAGMEGHRIFVKGRQRRWGGGGASLSVSEQLECMDLCLGVDEELNEVLGARIKGRIGTLLWGLFRAAGQED